MSVCQNDHFHRRRCGSALSDRSPQRHWRRDSRPAGADEPARRVAAGVYRLGRRRPRRGTAGRTSGPGRRGGRQARLAKTSSQRPRPAISTAHARHRRGHRPARTQQERHRRAAVRRPTSHRLRGRRRPGDQPLAQQHSGSPLRPRTSSIAIWNCCARWASKPSGSLDDPAELFNLPEAAEPAAAAADMLYAGQLLPSFALVNPGAGWASKLWPADRFAAVAEHLGRRHGLSVARSLGRRPGTRLGHGDRQAGRRPCAARSPNHPRRTGGPGTPCQAVRQCRHRAAAPGRGGRHARASACSARCRPSATGPTARGTSRFKRSA